MSDWADEIARMLFFEGSEKDIAAALRKARRTARAEVHRKSEVMQQLAYANGMKAGWNMAQADENVAHSERVAALVQEAMAELADIRRLRDKRP